MTERNLADVHEFLADLTPHPYVSFWRQAAEGFSWEHVVKDGDRYFRNGTASEPFDINSEYRTSHRVGNVEICAAAPVNKPKI